MVKRARALASGSDVGTVGNINTEFILVVTKIEEIVKLGLSTLASAALLAELIVMFANVVYRIVTGNSLVWSLEFGQVMLSVITFVGGAIAFERGEHMSMQAIVRRLPVRGQQIMGVLGNWFVLIMSLVTGFISIGVYRSRYNEFFTTMNLRQSWFVLPIIVGMFAMALFALLHVLKLPRKTVVITGLGMFALAAVAILASYSFGPVSQSTFILWPVLVLLVVLLLAGIPIGFVLPVSSLLYLFYSEKAPLIAVPQNMLVGTSNIVLIALPFFIMAGYIMTEGGISQRLANFIVSLLGHVRAGLLQVTVVSMFIFSGLSGSKTADVAAIGATMKSMLKSNGYDMAESTAVLASAAVMGETIPPSIVMLVLASITTLSVGGLFLAGLLPAAVIGLCLMVAVHVKARFSDMKPGQRAAFKVMLRDTLIAIPSLLVPVCLIGGIVTGLATPTESSTTAVVYALLLAVFAYKAMSVRSFWRLMIDSASTAGMVLYIVSAATSFSWSLTIANLPDKVAALLGSLSSMPWLFMLGSIVILIIMGTLLEGLPALLIFGPLLLPIGERIGVDPLQFGIVLIIAMGLGTFLPPIGVGMYVSCAVCGTTMEETSKHMIPYIVVLIFGLLLVGFVPQISLFIPHLLK
ncbi:sialic acid TRAP transporter permease protein SiaT [Peptococcaceae bacterium CEB3]|nr:sialic acid TRAP transporter permease protein SiaT [Peptococcaceae bacterium CEB3]